MKVKGNSLLTFVRSLACCVVLLTSAQAQAQNRTIGSQAGQQVGAAHDPSCAATIYSADNCGPCQALKARIQNNPDQYGCNAITYVSCGADYHFPSAQCLQLGIRSFPTIHGKLCDCRNVKPTPTPILQSPDGDPKPQPPGNPPSNGFECTGQAKIKCAAGNSWACCLYACDSSQASGCLNCGGYRPCGRNSCPSDKICVNKKDDKGCPKDFVCESKVTPPEDGGDMVCDPISGVCRPRNPLIDPPLERPDTPKPPEEPTIPPNPTATPIPPDPTPTPVPPVEPTSPSSGGQCDNPCPSQSNPSNCCGPRQGCYQGTCSNYSGCAGCKAGQICSPTDRAPWYGCKDKTAAPPPAA